jgi:hypothetical protein
MRLICRCVLFCAVAVLLMIAPWVAMAQTAGEWEIQLQPTPPAPVGERESPLELLGLRKPELGGIRISAFVVGSFSYNSGLQMVPEFAGGAAALADPGSSNFRFDKFGLSVAKTFAPWLSAGGSFEVENHRDRHTHLIASTTPNRLGCPSGQACERFGAEEAETEINLDKFNITGIAPLGNGLSLAIGRFDVPFGQTLIAGLLGGIFLLSSLGERKKAVIVALPFIGTMLDIGGMWLTRFVWPPLGVLVLLGGSTFALGYLLITLVAVYELWLKREVHP